VETGDLEHGPPSPGERETGPRSEEEEEIGGDE
jgi:hypothetical protein